MTVNEQNTIEKDSGHPPIVRLPTLPIKKVGVHVCVSTSQVGDLVAKQLA